jgi:histidinol-phosphate aminotransferase
MALSRRHFLGTAAATAAAGSLLGSDSLIHLVPRAAAAPSKAAGPIRLHSNENAYGPFPSVRKALGEMLEPACRYPDQAGAEFVAAAAALHKVPEDCILTGCGSGELLRMASLAFSGPGRNVVMAVPTFEDVRDYSREAGAKVTEVPLRSDHGHDLERMLAATDASTSLVFVCNPNNPTGTLTPVKEVAGFLDKLPPKAVALVDEAYCHYAEGAPGYASFIERATQDERVVVTRTFSKIYGMAGMRLGYAIGAPQTLEPMRKAQLRWGANGVVLRCGTVALQDAAGLAAAVRQGKADLLEFQQQAARRRLRTLPSFANFVMLEVGGPVRPVIAYFRQQGVRIGRPFPRLETYARISLGTAAEMREFWRVWDGMQKQDA